MSFRIINSHPGGTEDVDTCHNSSARPLCRSSLLTDKTVAEFRHNVGPVNGNKKSLKDHKCVIKLGKFM